MLTRGVIGRNHHDDAVRGRLGDGACVIDHSGVAERLVLLEGSEPLTTATADHDRPDVLNVGHNRAG